MSHAHSELMERFGLVRIPTKELHRLKYGTPYPLQQVYDRLTEIGALADCSVEDFRAMMEAEPGFTVDGETIMRYTPCQQRDLGNYPYFLTDNCPD